MQFAIDNKYELVKNYVEDKMSTYEIAEKFKTYPKKIERALKFLGVVFRSPSERVRVSIDSGRMTNPMTDERKEETRKKISETLAKRHKNLTKKQLADMIAKRKRSWEKMPDSTKHRIRESLIKGLRLSSKHGSNFEKFLHKVILDAGYNCYHHRNILENEKLEVDLWIPSLLLAIEFDGPSHREPIWGEDKLKKQQAADSAKNGLILSKGYRIIRIIYNSGNFTEKRKRDLRDNTLSLIEHIKNNGSKEVNYLELK